MNGNKKVSLTSGSGPKLDSEPEYQVGLLALLFIVTAILMNLVFGFDWFKFSMMVGGLIAALIICRNVGFRFAWSKKEMAASVLLLLTMVLVLTSLLSLNVVINEQASYEGYRFLTVTVLAPVSEEIIYRLFLLNLLFILTGRRFQAILISSVLFMTNHIGAYYADIPSLIVVFVFSVFAGSVFLVTRNLSATMAAHSFYNLSVSVKEYGRLYPDLMPFYLEVAILLLFIIFGILAILYYIGENEKTEENPSASRENVESVRSWLLERPKDTIGNSGFAVTSLAFLIFVFFAYLLPFTASTNGQPFYLLGVLGWSQFQITYYVGVVPPVPDPLLLLVVTIVFATGIVFLTIDALARLKQKRSAQATQRKGR